jgi:RND family efflux transporter MFP subunit
MRSFFTRPPLPGRCLGLAALLQVSLCGSAWAQEPSRPVDCIIEARQTVEIRSPVEALIESVKVQRGDLVSKGQVIATLQSGPERAALDLARTRAQSVGEIKVAEARVGITEKKLRRAEELFAQNFISANARDEARADWQLATEDLGRTRENQRLAEQEVKRAAEVLALRTITSPFAGVVVEVMLRPGEFGATTIKDPIMKLAQIDPLNVEVVLPVKIYGQIKIGQRATVMPEAPIGGNYASVVRVVDQVIDAKSGTFGVRLDLPNAKRAIPAGVRCQVKFAGLETVQSPESSPRRAADRQPAATK